MHELTCATRDDIQAIQDTTCIIKRTYTVERRHEELRVSVIAHEHAVRIVRTRVMIIQYPYCTTVCKWRSTGSQEAEEYEEDEDCDIRGRCNNNTNG